MFPLRLFKRESYDYKDIFTRHIAELRSLKSRDKLLNTVLTSLTEVFDVENACLLLREDENGSFIIKSHVGVAPAYMKLACKSPLLEWLSTHDEPLSIDMVTPTYLPRHRDKILKLMIELKAAAIVPLCIGQDMLGLAAIGSPKGRRFFNKEEKDLISIFGFEVAVSIQNAILYDELLKQNTKLKELSALKGSFISNMTHELATPLHNIIGLAQAVADGSDGEVNEEQRKHMEMICSAGEQLLKIHRAIMDLSQLEGCPEQLTVKKLNIRAMVEDFLPWLREEAESRDTTIVNEVSDDTPCVYGDEGKIRQVFEIILENATRFTSKGGIRISATPSGDMLKVTIEDTGVGIDPEHKNEIFEPFRQVDGGISRSHGGAGLGLALAKKIVEIHGGRLWLESALGQGSCFYFTLPIRPANIRALELQG
jgi:signal transduction histidine kinase